MHKQTVSGRQVGLRLEQVWPGSGQCTDADDMPVRIACGLIGKMIVSGETDLGFTRL